MPEIIDAEKEQRNKLLKYRCKNWDYFNAQCKRFLDNTYCHSTFQPQEKDFDVACDGKSNNVLCVYFVHQASTLKDVQRELKRYGVNHGGNNKRDP